VSIDRLGCLIAGRSGRIAQRSSGPPLLSCTTSPFLRSATSAPPS
jgi:hypothetical protein